MNQIGTDARPAVLQADIVEARSKERGEPGWLTQQRRTASERAAELPVPTRTTEGWRRTDLSGLDLDALLAGQGAAATADGVRGEDLGALAGALRLVDGRAADRQVDAELEKQGVLLLPLREALATRPDLVEGRLGKLSAGEDSKFVSLAEALWENGTFVYVPRNVTLDGPLVSRIVMASGAPAFWRTVIVVDEGADVTIVEDHVSDDAVGEALASGTVEIFTGQSARVRYVNLQQWNSQTWHFNRLRTEMGRDSRIDWLFVAVGGRVSRAEVDANLTGQGAETELVGLIFGTGTQHFDHQTLQDHFGNDTRSNLNFKAALGDSASSNYQGMIRVNTSALRTNSNLENRNLLLSDHSRADSDPKLEILNSDIVRCAHGATVGPVDREMIFYLQSRGIPRDEAMRMVVEAFFEEVLQKIPVAAIRTNVWRTIQRKLGRQVGDKDGPEGADAWQAG